MVRLKVWTTSSTMSLDEIKRKNHMVESPRDMFTRLGNNKRQPEPFTKSHSLPETRAHVTQAPKEDPRLKIIRLTVRSFVEYDTALTEYFNTVDERWTAVTRALQRPDNQNISHRLFKGGRSRTGLTLAGMLIGIKAQRIAGYQWTGSHSQGLRDTIHHQLQGLRADAGIPEGNLALRMAYPVMTGTSGESKAEVHKFNLVAEVDDRTTAYFLHSRRLIRSILQGEVPHTSYDVDSPAGEFFTPSIPLGIIAGSNIGIDGCQAYAAALGDVTASASSLTFTLQPERLLHIDTAQS